MPGAARIDLRQRNGGEGVVGGGAEQRRAGGGDGRKQVLDRRRDVAQGPDLGGEGPGPGDVDLILVATTTPDMVFPSTACILQAKLGIKQGAAFDVQAVCTGFIYALATADSEASTGATSTASACNSRASSPRGR